jgi:hypothetical protein
MKVSLESCSQVQNFLKFHKRTLQHSYYIVCHSDSIFLSSLFDMSCTSYTMNGFVQTLCKHLAVTAIMRGAIFLCMCSLICTLGSMRACSVPRYE